MAGSTGCYTQTMNLGALQQTLTTDCVVTNSLQQTHSSNLLAPPEFRCERPHGSAPGTRQAPACQIPQLPWPAPRRPLDRVQPCSLPLRHKGPVFSLVQCLVPHCGRGPAGVDFAVRISTSSRGTCSISRLLQLPPPLFCLAAKSAALCSGFCDEPHRPQKPPRTCDGGCGVWRGLPTHPWAADSPVLLCACPWCDRETHSELPGLSSEGTALTKSGPCLQPHSILIASLDAPFPSTARMEAEASTYDSGERT